MDNTGLKEYIVFVMLIVIVVFATGYLVYKAAFRFDPYYEYETSTQK